MDYFEQEEFWDDLEAEICKDKLENMFPIGSRVFLCVDKDQDDEIDKGEEGTVLGYVDLPYVDVRWDKHSTNRHTCNAMCEAGHGWRVYPFMLSSTEQVEETDISPIGDDLL